MKILKPTTKFKKDYKRIRNNPQKVAKFEEVANMLINDIPIPDEYSPHYLSGQFEGYMECHLGFDYLLIWLDVDDNTIKLVRLGSHSELFD